VKHAGAGIGSLLLVLHSLIDYNLCALANMLYLALCVETFSAAAVMEQQANT